MAAAPAIITNPIISAVIYHDPVITLTFNPNSGSRYRAFTCFLDGIQLNPMEYASRSVWLLPWYGLVIKADTGWQTPQERLFYMKKLRPEDAQYFPKRITCGQLVPGLDFIVQEYVSVTTATGSEVPLLVKRLCDKYGIMDVCNNRSNWGFKKYTETPCILDLGMS